jgi:hypothetical protein
MGFSLPFSKNINHKGHEGTLRNALSQIASYARYIVWSPLGAKAKNQKPRTKSQEPKAKNQKPTLALPLCSFVSFVVKFRFYFLTSKLIVAPAVTRCPAGGYCRRMVPGASGPSPSAKRTFPSGNPPLINATFASANGFPTKLGIT